MQLNKTPTVNDVDKHITIIQQFITQTFVYDNNLNTVNNYLKFLIACIKQLGQQSDKNNKVSLKRYSSQCEALLKLLLVFFDPHKNQTGRQHAIETYDEKINTFYSHSIYSMSFYSDPVARRNNIHVKRMLCSVESLIIRARENETMHTHIGCRPYCHKPCQ